MTGRQRVGLIGRARRARRVAALGLGLTALAACAAQTQATVSLRVQGNVADASVTIDDQYVGALAFVASRGVALPPGAHRITVEKAGYFPWDALVEAKSGDAPIHLRVELTPVPD